MSERGGEGREGCYLARFSLRHSLLLHFLCCPSLSPSFLSPLLLLPFIPPCSTTEFDPDICLVTMEVAGAKAAPPAPVAGGAAAGAAAKAGPGGAPIVNTTSSIFAHEGRTGFVVENREMFGFRQDHASAKKFLLANAKEPLEKRLSDFHLLCWLAQATDPATAAAATEAVTRGKKVDEGLALLVEGLTA